MKGRSKYLIASSDPAVYQLDKKTHKIIEAEVNRRPPLVGFITGSGATGDATSRSDIDIIFITEDEYVVSYRYYMPGLTTASIRTEVGRIPIAYLERVLTKGYDEEISTGLKEQLRKAKIIIGQNELGQRIISSFQALKPKQILLGNYIHQARQSFQKLKQALSRLDPLDSIIQVDAFGSNCWRLMLVAKYAVGVQKTKHEIKAARSFFDPKTLENYMSSRRINEVRRSDARNSILEAHRLLSRILAQLGISDKLIAIAEIENEPGHSEAFTEHKKEHRSSEETSD